MHVSWTVVGLVFALGLHGSPRGPEEFTFEASGPAWKTEIALAPDGLGGSLWKLSLQS